MNLGYMESVDRIMEFIKSRIKLRAVGLES
jgi:hypothetical protein